MRTKIVTHAAAAFLAASFALADTKTHEAAPATGLVRKAELFAARQSWDAAIDAYRSAIRESPKDPALRNRLGICYQNAGETKRAQKAYRAAIHLRKDYAEAWNNLGTLEHSQKDYAQAIAHYSRAVGFKPNDPVAYRNLGAAWAARGDLARAFAAWGQAYRIDPAFVDSPGAAVVASGISPARQYYLFAKLFAGHGQTDNALEYLSKARALGFADFATVEGDRDFAGLVADPRYVALK
jgi:tetratricopeptide (TPR) repeat protein